MKYVQKSNLKGGKIEKETGEGAKGAKVED
jgi:hypothetical protein